MKIIHVTAYYPPHLGGMELCIKELAERTSRLGYNVNVFTSNIGKPLLTKRPKIFALRTIQFAHTPFTPSLLLNLLKEINSDTILHLHTGVAFFSEIGYIASRIKKVPYVIHIHGDVKSSGKLGFIHPFYINNVLKHVLKKANKIVFLTNDYKKSFCEKYQIDTKNTIVIPNGTMMHGYHRVRMNLRKRTVKLLSVGRLSKQKNLFRLIESVAILNKKFDIKLNIVGDGEDKQKLIDFIERLNLNDVVTLKGRVSDDELVKYYSSSDIFVMSSDYEGFGLVFVEAMASGLPIVSTNILGAREILKNHAVLTELTPKSLSAGIESLINDDQKRHDLSRIGKIESKKYDWNVIINNLIDVYKEIGGRKI
jgi:glycosyltransferase involved in cell wall biosynthesis